MKALTLHQPFASLVAIGAKRIETRSWSTSYRGPLAIHASAKGPRTEADGTKAFDAALLAAYRAGIEVEQIAPLPYGAVVATCRLVDVVPIAAKPNGETCVAPGEDGVMRAWHRFEVNAGGGGWYGDPSTGEEAAFGDFTPSRYAFLLADVEPLDPPVPAKGRQGLWTWAYPGGER